MPSPSEIFKLQKAISQACQRYLETHQDVTYTPTSPEDAAIYAELKQKIAPCFIRPITPIDPSELAKLSPVACDCCGLCCSRIDTNPYLAALEREQKDGYCQYFDLNTKLCRIYAHRPLLCNVKEGYLVIFKELTSWEVFNAANAQSCNIFKQMHAKQVFLKNIPAQKV